MRALAVFVHRINLRYWSRHRLRTSLTVFGVVIGVTLVVAVAVINSTLLSTVRDTARSVAGDADIEVAAPDSTGLKAAAVEKISAIDGVKAAVPVLRTYTTLHNGSHSQRVLIIGTTYDFHWLFHQAAGDGALSISGKLMSHNGILLAAETAEKLEVSLGEGFEAETPTRHAGIVTAGTFSGELVDRLETGDLAIMSLTTAQELFDRNNRVDSVYVVAEDRVDVDRLESAIANAVGGGAIVGTPGDRVAGFEETLNGIAAISSLAGTVALFVSAFVVFNTMSMAIVERRREISLTLALGATRKQVVAAFVGEAAVLGIASCTLGIAAGFFLAKVMVQPGLDGLRVFSITAVAGASLSWSHVLLGLASGVGVAVVASYLPARRILNVAPVEALRPHGAYRLSAAEVEPDRRRTIVRWGVGTLLISTCLALGPMISGNLERATWATNAQLLGLLAGVTVLLPDVVRGVLGGIRRLASRAAGVHLRLALDSLRRNSSRTTVTVGALAFTLGTVISVGGALDSYKSQWGREARSWYGGPIQITSPSFVSLGSDQPLPPSLAGILEKTDGVGDVYEARYRIVNIEGRQTAVYVVPYVEQMADRAMPAYGEAGRDRIGSILGRGDVVISALASRKKGVEVGDMLEVPTPTGMASFRVGAIATDLNPLDSMYMSNQMFLEHWRAPAVDRYETTVEEGAGLAETANSIRAEAEAARIPVTVRTREQLVADTFAPIDQVFTVARAVQLVALIVAALAIANTMFISVIERRWELGLQRAVGMDGAAVTRTLLAEAGAIALIGAAASWLVGIVMGWLMVQDMEKSYALSFAFEIPFDLLALTLVVGGVIALIASAYPSRAALRTPIIESLRFE